MGVIFWCRVHPLISTVNIILGFSDFNPAADVNQDSVVNVLDVISIVNIILGG